jgi:acyl-CoA thioesterase-2
MYGGTMAAQLLAAARATTPTLRTSSVHLSFLRPADGGRPVDYHVEGVQDGKSTATRRVTAMQDDLIVAVGAVNLHTPRPGWEHGGQAAVVLPDMMSPTGTPHRSRAVTDMDFDIRFYDEWVEGRLIRRLWFRTVRPQPAAIQVNECTLLYISDIYFFEPLCLQHGYAGNDRALRYATTQHSVWFHSTPRVDEWLLLESHSPVLSGGRGLVHGEVRTADGQPIATVIQEAVVRVVNGGDGR